MDTERQKAIVGQFMDAWQKGDAETMWGLQADDVVYNINGHLPISGRTEGKGEFIEKIVPLVFPHLRIADFRFCTKWKVMCADGTRVVTIMDADGYGNNGVRYDQRYLHIFEFRDGLISEVWEFFDTALTNAVIFTPENVQGMAIPSLKSFEF